MLKEIDESYTLECLIPENPTKHMNITMSRTKKTDDGNISFPVLQCWDPSREIATIAAQVSGERVLCRISLAVLKKKFHIFTDEPMKDITKYRSNIEAAAIKLIEEKAFEEDGSINIQYKDL